MRSDQPQIISKTFSFILFIGLELWIFFEAYRLYAKQGSTSYSGEELFWLFVLIMIAPVLPQITFFTKNKFGAAILHVIVLTALIFVIALEPLFIPKLPAPEVITILFYAYIATGVGYLRGRNNLAEQTKAQIAYTSFRIIAFFVGVFISGYLGNQSSFSENYLLYILITIPVFLAFTFSIFINFELKSPKGKS